MTGAISDYDWPKTLALAASLQPTARDVVVISGASDHDRYWNEDARRDLEPIFNHTMYDTWRVFPMMLFWKRWRACREKQ